jgi:hypothetical protein
MSKGFRLFSKKDLEDEIEAELGEVREPKEVRPVYKEEPKVSEAKVVRLKGKKATPVVAPGRPTEFERCASHPYNIKTTLANARLAVERSGITFSFNEFSGQYLASGSAGSVDVSDDLLIMVRGRLLDAFGFDVGKNNLIEVVKGQCLAHGFNPVTRWLDGLEWDGVARIDTWLIDFLHAEDTALNRAFGRKVMCALVRRGKRPGSKFDHVLVLEGEEDIGKSMAVKALALSEDYFSDQGILAATEKEQQELARGKHVYELGELIGIRRAEVEKVKGFVSRTHDRCRPAWGRFVVNQPRTCVFIGTTNDREYLASQTGNRRWWPVGWLSAKIDWQGLGEARDRLFAEAVLAEPAEDLFLPHDLAVAARDLQESRRLKHPWEDLLSGLAETPPKCSGAKLVADQYRIHSAWIFTNLLGIAPAQQHDSHAKTLSAVMRKLGWDKSRTVIRVGPGSKPGNGYVKTVLSLPVPEVGSVCNRCNGNS